MAVKSKTLITIVSTQIEAMDQDNDNDNDNDNTNVKGEKQPKLMESIIYEDIHCNSKYRSVKT